MSQVLDSLLTVLSVLWEGLLTVVKEDTFQFLVLLLVFVRLLGTTVPSGKRGVLYRFGKVQRLLDPGFHWLLPAIQTVRMVESRSRTIDIPAQRVTTGEGLVYVLDANLVYRIVDPREALVEVDDYEKGCAVALALSVQEVIRGTRRQDLAGPEGLSSTLEERLGPRLRRWGIEVERVGFTTVTPDSTTLRITQLGPRVRAAREVRSRFRRAGVSEAIALSLLGARQHLTSRSRQRYRPQSTSAGSRAAQKGPHPGSAGLSFQ